LSKDEKELAMPLPEVLINGTPALPPTMVKKPSDKTELSSYDLII
jgi:hypothetical protein